MTDEIDIGDVDIDNSKIEVNEEWLTSKDLKSTIKTKIEAGDYDVTAYATALKKLENTLKALEDVELRVPVAILNAYKDLASDDSATVESTLRKGLTEYLRYHNKLKPLEDIESEDENKGSVKGKGKKKSK